MQTHLTCFIYDFFKFMSFKAVVLEPKNPKMKTKEQKLLEFVQKNPLLSSREIFEGVGNGMSYATAKRLISKMTQHGMLEVKGRGKGTRYKLGIAYELFLEIDQKEYFGKTLDQRIIKNSYSKGMITEVLKNVRLFTDDERERLQELQQIHRKKVKELSESHYKKELERVVIDLIWKSSQIEGGRYSLLETERLIKDKIRAEGRKKDEAIILLNHKECFDFIVEHPHYVNSLSIAKIEYFHHLLTKGLELDPRIRSKRLGIPGTNYHPLELEEDIRQAGLELCQLINEKEDVFEKALIILVMISYIHMFVDGNKRTARMLANALLMCHGCCPISYRTASSVDYKKALILFYEQNSIAAFKNIFLEQYEWAVGEYF